MSAVGDGERPWPRWFWPAFVVGVVVNLLPLVVAPILPFCDLHGAAALLGALLRRGDPAARIDQYFTFNVHPSPNALYWAVGWLLAQVMSVEAATNVYIGLFCIVALPVSLLLAVRALGKDPTLSLLALPIVYHRCVWYGFMGSVPAVALLLLVLAFASRAFARPRASWCDAALAGTLLALATAHAFLYVVALGITLLWAVLARGLPSAWWRRWLAPLPSLAYLGPWLYASFARRGADGGGGLLPFLAHLWRKRQPFRTYLVNVHEWFINGYAGPVDEAVAVVFALTLAVLLVRGLRPSGSTAPSRSAPPATEPPLWRARIAVSAALLGGGYFLLPMSISVPFEWWAVNVRLLVPCVLVLVLLVPTRARGLPRVALLPVAAVAVFYGAYLTHDFHTWWMGGELQGFRESIAAIPPGQRVQALYPPFENERHYSHFPMAYIVDHYVIDRGGTASPIMSGHPKELWAHWIPPGPGPGWGMARAFRWRAHARFWDYFLVKQPAPGNGPTIAPFADAPPGEVTRVFEQGLWSVWKRTSAQ